MDKVEKLFGAVFAVLLLAALYFWHDGFVRYETACKDAGGTPVWNGSFQECIYKDRKNVTP
jgi:hypothetical protein